MWITGLIICFGWIFSLCLHEFAHALVAYWGGDKTVKNKGYLTFNLFKYTQPGLSIIMPLFFILIGGMALPGGAVYINHRLLKNRFWHSLVSAAGVFANGLFALVLILPFWLLNNRVIEGVAFSENYFRGLIFASLAYLIYIEVFAVFFNLLPIPGLDGYGIIKPWLPKKVNQRLTKYSKYSYLVIFGVFFFVPEFARFFFGIIQYICNFLGISDLSIDKGRYLFRQPINQLIAIIIILVLGYFLRFSEHNWYQKGNKLTREEKDAEAIAAYDKAIAIKADCAEAWLGKGDAYYRLKDYRSAIESYQKAIQLNPQEYDALLFLAHAYFNLKDYHAAAAAYQRAINLKSDLSEGKDYLYLAESLYLLEKPEEAIAVLDEGIKINPQYFQLWIYKAAYLYELKKYQKIIELKQLAPDLKPDNLKFYYFVGLSFIKKKQYSEAKQIFEQMIALEPENILSLLGLAEVYYQKQNYAAAIELYQKITSIEANYATAWYNMACCHALQQNAKRAIAALQKAIAIEPEKTIKSIEQDKDLSYLKNATGFQNLLEQ